MRAAFWEQVAADGFAVPGDEPLADLTTELTVMLGATDPRLRLELARATLRRWISDGVYDDLLGGLGDGIAEGLRVGLGETDTDTVLRRTACADILTACLRREAETGVCGADTVLRWGDALLTWWLRERDLRDTVPTMGAADAITVGARAVTGLAEAPTLGEAELLAVLDVVADRLATPTSVTLGVEQSDEVARAALAVLRRDLVPVELAESWVERVGDLAVGSPAPAAEAVVRNARATLRSLHLQLALSPHPPHDRGDLALAVVDALRRSHQPLLR